MTRISNLIRDSGGAGKVQDSRKLQNMIIYMQDYLSERRVIIIDNI
jgi:hypothetical protein